MLEMKQITGNLLQEREEADLEAEVADVEAEMTMTMMMTGKKGEVPQSLSPVKREVIHTKVVDLEEVKKRKKSRLYLLPSLLLRLF